MRVSEWELPWSRRWVWTAVLVALSVYLYEMTGTTLSLDEEVVSFDSPIDQWYGWIRQGRWGMALMAVTFPPFTGAIPFLSVTVFVIGLCVSSLILCSVITKKDIQAIPFLVVFIGSPVWLHVAQYATLTYGLGVVLVIAALTVPWLMRRDGRGWLAASLGIAFCMSVYQTLVLMPAIVILFCILGCADGACRLDEGGKFRFAIFSATSFLFGIALYLVIGWLFIRFSGGRLEYVGQFIGHEIDPVRVVKIARSYLTGGNKIFLGRGAVVLLPVFLGVLAVFLAALRSRREGVRLLALFGGFVVATSPIVVSNGIIPVRGLIGLPVIYAIAASLSFSWMPRLRFVQYAILGYVLIIQSWISVSLFYSERLTRQRDEITAAQLIAEINQVAGSEVGDSIPVVLIGGLKSYPFGDSPARMVEMFGASFFSHDGGNIKRVLSYLNLLGVGNMVPGDRSVMLEKHAGEISGMPEWPVVGSVALIDGTVVVKFDGRNWSWVRSASATERIGTPVVSPGLRCTLESVTGMQKDEGDSEFLRSQELRFGGWLAHPVERIRQFQILLHGSSDFEIQAEINVGRRDVAEAVGVSHAENSGFSVAANVQQVSPGSYEVFLQNMKQSDGYCRTGKTIVIQ